VLDRVIESVATSGDGLHGDGGSECSVAGSMALLGVEFPGPVLFDLGAVSTATAKRVRVLGTSSGTGSAQDTGDTSTLAPPFDGVLHTGHGSALSDVSARTVGLATVGSAGSDGQLDEVFTDLGFECSGEVHLGTVRNFDIKTGREFASVHLGLGDRVDNVLGCDLHLQAPCLDAVLTYVIS